MSGTHLSVFTSKSLQFLYRGLWFSAMSDDEIGAKVPQQGAAADLATGTECDQCKLPHDKLRMHNSSGNKRYPRWRCNECHHGHIWLLSAQNPDVQADLGGLLLGGLLLDGLLLGELLLGGLLLGGVLLGELDAQASVHSPSPPIPNRRHLLSPLPPLGPKENL